MKIRISDGLVLGDEFVVSTAGCFGVKGTGKTHIAQVAAEEMLKHGHVVVAIDPTDVWWGLRASADGQHEGYPILVIGGDHGDLKLDLDSGAKLAEAVVKERFSVVICTDGLKDTEQIRFVRQFLETLFRLNRDPLHLFVDEADIFAPQTPDEQEQVFCRRALGHIVRRGRRKGIGSTLITQRPAELHATVRSMIETLFVLGLSHNLDIEAVEKWLRLRKRKDGDNSAFELREQMIDSLDSLPRGDAWVWAPRLKPPLHRRFRARDKETFDSGATPKPGHRVRTAKRLAPVDIARLGAAIADAAQRQRDNDPTELKKQVAALRRDLDRVGKGQDRAETNEKANHVENIDLRAEVARLKAQLGTRQKTAIAGSDVTRLEKVIARAEVTLAKQDTAVSRHHQAYEVALESYTKTSKSIVSAALLGIDELRAAIREATMVPPPARVQEPAKPSRPASRVQEISAAWNAIVGKPAAKVDADLKPVHLRILSAIAWWESVGVPTPDLTGVAFVAGTTTTSSAFDNNRSRLSAAGYIDYPSKGRVQLTAAGRELTPSPSLPATNEALHDTILAKVTPVHGRMLRVLIESFPKEIALAEFAERAGTTTTSSAFDNNRSWLCARGLAEYPRKGFVRATDLLFPGAS